MTTRKGKPPRDPQGVAPRTDLWETTPMAHRKTRGPIKGDRVAALGHNGAFVVYGVDSSARSAELKLIGGDFALSSIPWSTLTFLDEEDASQAAARIVREATENN